MPPGGRLGSGMETLRLWREVKRSHDDRLDTAEERRLAGRITGALWVSGGLTLLVMLPMPGERIERVWLVAGIAGVAGARGGGPVRGVRWERAPRWLFYASTALMPAVVALLQVRSGGEASPTHQYLWLVVVYTAFFFRPVGGRLRHRVQRRERRAPAVRHRCGRGQPRARVADRRAALLHRRRDHLRRPRAARAAVAAGHRARARAAPDGRGAVVAAARRDRRRRRRAARGHLRARLRRGRAPARRRRGGDRAVHLRAAPARHGRLARRDR